MTSVAARSYALGSSTVALLTVAALVPAAVGLGPRAVPWIALGWALMTVVGVAGGAWMAARHGEPGPDFLRALGTCILSRLTGAALGAALAATAGMPAVWAYLAGLGAGFVSLQLFEIGWFLRRTRGLTPARGSDAVGH